MRRLLAFVVTVCIFQKGFSQKTALLSKDFETPILFTDSVTVEQISSGYFAVSVDDFDTLYANLNYLKEMLSTRQRSKMQSFELRSGRTVIVVERMPSAYGDQYSMIAKTKSNEINSVISLFDLKKSNKKNGENIEKLMKYMASNKSLFKAPNEIRPKIYNIVVITDR